MEDLSFYVALESKENKISDINMAKIKKIEVELNETQIPFTNEYIDIYLFSDNKQECITYINNLDEDIQKYFQIKQIGSNLSYTAFIDILGFSNHINNIDNIFEAEEFYEKFKLITNYIESEENDNSEIFQKNKIQYSWISDTFVIKIEYLDDTKELKKEVNIRSLLVARLSLIISSIHHYMITEFGLIVRGGISSKLSYIRNNFLIGQGIVEASKLEKDIASDPRVIFEKSIINNLDVESLNNYILKDSDDYYFINYLEMLKTMPPMIGLISKYSKISAEKMILKTISKYEKVIENGLHTENTKIQAKYKWLNNYYSNIFKG